MHKENKIKGSLIGGAIGDALGYPIEFKRNIKERQVTRYVNDKGIISDDTQMTLFTANGLLWRETRLSLRGIAMSPTDAIYLSYLDWLETQTGKVNNSSISWIKNLKELNIERAPGNTCLSALNLGRKGTIKKPINDSKGCGGVMRIAPIGLYYFDPEKAGEYSVAASALTHGHLLGIIPSYVLGVLINLLVNNELTLYQAVEKSMQIYEKNHKDYDKKYKKEFVDLINKAIVLSQKDYSDVDAIAVLGEGWVAEEALAIALYSCLKYPNSFEDAIICAVNHDGDSDSTGAIAGNIMGAYLGLTKIPEYYVKNLELKEEILEIAEDLAKKVPISEFSDNEDKYWESKYVYCKRDTKLKNNKL